LPGATAGALTRVVDSRRAATEARRMASHPIRFGIQTGQECVDTVERDPGGAGPGFVSDPERPTAPSPAPGRAGTLAGACPCGAVRFEIGAVFDCRYCHCSRCRHSSGAPFTVGAVVKPGDFHLTTGSVGGTGRGEKGVEQRCAACRAEVAFAFETS